MMSVKKLKSLILKSQQCSESVQLQCPKCKGSNEFCYSHFVERYDFKNSYGDANYDIGPIQHFNDIGTVSLDKLVGDDFRHEYRTREESSLTVYSCEIQGSYWCEARFFHKGGYFVHSTMLSMLDVMSEV